MAYRNETYTTRTECQKEFWYTSGVYCTLWLCRHQSIALFLARRFLAFHDKHSKRHLIFSSLNIATLLAVVENKLDSWYSSYIRSQMGLDLEDIAARKWVPLSWSSGRATVCLGMLCPQCEYLAAQYHVGKQHPVSLLATRALAKS
jgi:hypothetical protein